MVLVESSAEQREFLRAARAGTPLSYWASRRPEATAVVAGAQRRTFAQLDQQADRIARALRARGHRAGDGIAALLANRPDSVAVLAAAQRIGARLTPINWHLNPEEVRYIVADCEARTLVADSRFAPAALLAATVPAVAARLAIGGAIPGFDDLGAAAAAESPDPVDDPRPGTTMLYTSGTTGRPKGVVKPPRHVGPAAMTGDGDWPGAPSPRIVAGRSLSLVTGPLYHAAPLFFSLTHPMTAGAGAVLMERFDAREALRLIDVHRITHSHMVPTMFRRMLTLPPEVRARFDVSSLVHVWHGAAACPVADKQAMIDWWGPVLVEYYSSTEGPATYVGSEEWLRKPGTVGRPVPAELVRILDADGRPVAPGAVGTIWIRTSPDRRFSYYRDPEKTARTYQDDYFTLGDIGRLDDDGYLFLTDRSADLIISGGVNIYPAEVEAVLAAHHAVGDVAVVGVPDAEWGERVLAVVEPVPDVAAGPELAAELIAYCRARIAHFKCPRHVEFADLERTQTGKLPKNAIRERYR
ncbi:AMP-binding protein [Pseudonocardia sulfidoxydans]|nr:AMP-binding protein [Pseudonocardia sulfidoxydans]